MRRSQSSWTKPETLSPSPPPVVCSWQPWVVSNKVLQLAGVPQDTGVDAMRLRQRCCRAQQPALSGHCSTADRGEFRWVDVSEFWQWNSVPQEVNCESARGSACMYAGVFLHAYTRAHAHMRLLGRYATAWAGRSVRSRMVVMAIWESKVE